MREYEGARLLVAVNAGDHPARPWAPFDGAAAAPLWGEGEALAGGGVLRLSMAPRSGAVWSVD